MPLVRRFIRVSVVAAAAAAMASLLAAQPSAYAGSGPDLVICRIGGTNMTSGFMNLGSSGGIRAFSADSVICNFGDMQCGWDDDPPEPDNNHPVISQTMYRLKSGRFIQIGQSWVKHGGNATNQPECGLTCQPSGTSSILGIGCCDAYNALVNGSQNVGPKSDVNPSTAFFPYPFCSVSDGSINCPGVGGSPIARRLQVSDSEIDTTAGTQYFFQIHMVVPDELNVAVPRSDFNNASYRPVNIGTNLNISSWAGFTTDGDPAIKAWKRNGLGPNVADPDVKEYEVEILGDGKFYFAAKAANLGGGVWSYEYAVQNYNSDRGGASFTVPLPVGAGLTNIGYHDVDYHSGEPYANVDWVTSFTPTTITWAGTQTYQVNPLGNALRWDTLYNFRFHSTKPPKMGLVSLGLFKPASLLGQPDVITALLPVPGDDCNGNQIADALDIQNGTSVDANADGVPDECQTPCPANIVDAGASAGQVDIDDLLAVISAWGVCPDPVNCPADITPAAGNGVVDIDDLLAVISAWGLCSSK